MHLSRGLKWLKIVSSTQETQLHDSEFVFGVAILAPFPDMRRGFAASHHLSSFKLNEEKHE